MMDKGETQILPNLLDTVCSIRCVPRGIKKTNVNEGIWIDRASWLWVKRIKLLSRTSCRAPRLGNVPPSRFWERRLRDVSISAQSGSAPSGSLCWHAAAESHVGREEVGH